METQQIPDTLTNPKNLDLIVPSLSLDGTFDGQRTGEGGLFWWWGGGRPAKLNRDHLSSTSIIVA